MSPSTRLRNLRRTIKYLLSKITISQRAPVLSIKHAASVNILPTINKERNNLETNIKPTQTCKAPGIYHQEEDASLHNLQLGTYNGASQSVQ